MDTIRFELRSPEELGENTDSLEHEPFVTLIYINDKELCEHIRPLEVRYCKAENDPDSVEGYAHLPPWHILFSLTHGPQEHHGDPLIRDWFYPLACPHCGCDGCSSPNVVIDADAECVFWNINHHNQCPGLHYGLLFTFSRKQYEAALKTLENL